MKIIGTGSQPILLLHPYLLPGELYYDMVAPYADAYTFLIPDYAGYGTNQDLPGPYTLARYADDVAAQLLGYPALPVVGYSMGGQVAQLLSLRYPEKVSSLVLGCTYAHKPQKLHEIMQKHAFPGIVHRLGGRGLARVMYSEVRRVWQPKREDISLLKRLVEANRTDVITENAREIFRIDTRKQLGEVAAPSLVIAGGKDWIVPLHHSKQLVKIMPSSQLKIISGAGHFAIYTHRLQFWELALAFIKTHAS